MTRVSVWSGALEVLRCPGSNQQAKNEGEAPLVLGDAAGMFVQPRVGLPRCGEIGVDFVKGDCPVQADVNRWAHNGLNFQALLNKYCIL